MVGVVGRGCGGVTGVAGRRDVVAIEGETCAKADCERENGFLRAGYPCAPMGGTGGTERSNDLSDFALLLKAFLMVAKDDFLVGAEETSDD